MFLNPILVGALAAVAAPIIIHLLHRSRVLPQDWGAMMFLQELLAERARRLRMQEIILLLVRCLIVTCLSLAVMRPAFLSPTAGVRSPGTHTSAIVLLDDSYSMNAGRAHTAWQEAREQALAYINTLIQGDDVTVMLTSSAGKGTAPAALFDLERAREIVRTAAPRFEKTDMPRALGAALREVEARHNPRRELVLFSDMQAAGWELTDRARWSFLANAVQSSRIRPNIIFAGTSDARPENLAVMQIDASRQVVDCYTPVSFNVTVASVGRATGTAPQEATVTFVVDHAPKATRTVSLAPGAREAVAFEHRFDRPGSHFVAFRLRAAQDALDEDNELVHSVVVIDRLPVLLVDGDRRARSLASESDFLRMALSPKDPDDPLWRTVIETTVMDIPDLRYAEFSRYRVVVLANVAALPASAVADLERFVVAGGGLLITLGDRVQAEAYNRNLFRQGAGLLPVALKRIEGARGGGGALTETRTGAPVRLVANEPAGEPVRLAAIVSNAPALDLFRPEKGQDWTRARIRNYFSTAAPGEGSRGLATFSNGDLALIQKPLGEGKVMLFTSAVDMEWSDLPVHPFYVPLMQNLVFDLASAIIPPRNLAVGQTLAYVATGPAALKPHFLYPPGKSDGRHSGGKPANAAALKPQRQGALSIFTHEETAAPGLYAVTLEGAAPEEQVYYTVTADRAESALARLSDQDFQQLERDLGARRADGWDALARLIKLEAGGYEISKYLLMAAIALCFLEVYLTRRWG
jgi:hypothetical protein